MKLVFGIFFLVIGLWFLGGQIRAWPPRTYRDTYLHPSKPSNFVIGFLVIITAWGTGISLILEDTWWWIFLICGIGAVMLLAIIVGSARYR